MSADPFAALSSCGASPAAMIYRDAEFSGQQVQADVSKVSAALAGLGVRRRDRIAVLAGNTPIFVYAVLGLIRLRTECVLLSTYFKRSELQRCIQETQPQWLLTDGANSACEDLLGPSVTPHCRVALGDGRSLAICQVATSAAACAPKPLSDEIFTIQFTSGVRGKSKIVPRTYPQLADELVNFGSAIALNESDTVLCPAPLFHTYGFVNGFLLPRSLGAKIILLDSFLPNDITEAIEHYRPTVFVGAPPLYKALAETYRDRKVDLSSLRICFSAGSRLPAGISTAFAERYCRRINQQYGSTETGVMAMDLHPETHDDNLIVGRAVPGRVFKIVDAGGEELPPGEEGEIAVLSKATTSGYLGMPELTAQKFRNGWYLTGDVGRIGIDGYLQVTGRVATFVNIGGFKVDPVEVEEVLLANPAVRECAVVGVQTTRNRGEILKAFIVAEDSVTPAQLVGFCRQRLATYKVPQEIELRPQLPRSPTGKVLLKYLAE